MLYPTLFSPFKIGTVEIRNRILSTGHDTYLPVDGLPSEALIAYQVARARGGTGLIIIQVVGVHETARYTDALLMGTHDDCIPHFARLITAVQSYGTKVFVQLFHPGREILSRIDGILQPAYAPSATPSERFRVAPLAMSIGMVEDIIDGYGQTARRMAEAGADGVEIVASHGYLPSQFINAQVNKRSDRYGGSIDNRLRFTREVISCCRSVTPENFVVGMRYSAFDADHSGNDDQESLATLRALAPGLDYLNVIAGTSASSSGAVHIVPSMATENAYLAPFAQRIKQATGKPTLVAGRINQPQQAEQILVNGEADMCGMTRALICDPDMPNKAKDGRGEDVRACIGCNQACIGHFQLGLPISCIQRPETGRELEYDILRPALEKRKILVVGGGVAGMKAAVVAASRGHTVTLKESGPRLGGQALIAQLIPGRAEFGGIVTNLEHEMNTLDISVQLNQEVTPMNILTDEPDAIIVATGSQVSAPELELGDKAQVEHAVDVLTGRSTTGQRVVVYDWCADWTGVGVAEMLTLNGCTVRLAVNGACAAESMQRYMRDEVSARLFRSGVEVLPFMRLFGVDQSSAYFYHTTDQQPVVLDGIDTVVLVWPNTPDTTFVDSLEKFGGDVHFIGDAVCSRTCEEAVYEGLRAGNDV